MTRDFSKLLADRLVIESQSSPSHGPAWAVLALWQKISGEDHLCSLKQAIHFGSEDIFVRESERLAVDTLNNSIVET